MDNYKALDSNSQGISDNVLYFDKDVAPDSLYECIYSRLDAVEQLHDELIRITDNEVRNKPISAVTSILLSDIKSMFHKVYDHTKALNDAQKEIAEYKNKINKLTEIIDKKQISSTSEDS
ncbi:hypothetical protein ACVWBY_03495 [Escherichia coli]|uniref:hypothetical protein n=1 Tax=Escherichia coli TaxID=562 RepID=UPI001D77D938|nr:MULTISPECIES: hypothetical protein [Enterobacterales]EFN6654561.1 hypothetical protein [Escherichia coli O166:H6]EFN6737881.1 hypothetical protein [Escherichia coli H6]MDE8641941.1 hypothetical protein [Proteus mirabilis]